jgi:hypothetical protein|tara:strand:+ start:2501 stop:2992 length:492 start_codon:yes stop_codon:yes gene_type:complete
MRYSIFFSRYTFLILLLLTLSCSREREVRTEDGSAPPPPDTNTGCETSQDNCQINDIPTGNLYQISITESECSTFVIGSNITVYMNSDIYSFGQAKEIALFNNDNKVLVFGTWLLFSNNNRTIQIPSNIVPADCYNIRVSKEGETIAIDDDETYISEPFSIVQ